jgi:hypothetical protein
VQEAAGYVEAEQCERLPALAFQEGIGVIEDGVTEGSTTWPTAGRT